MTITCYILLRALWLGTEQLPKSLVLVYCFNALTCMRVDIHVIGPEIEYSLLLSFLHQLTLHEDLEESFLWVVFLTAMRGLSVGLSVVLLRISLILEYLPLWAESAPRAICDQRVGDGVMSAYMYCTHISL